MVGIPNVFELWSEQPGRPAARTKGAVVRVDIQRLPRRVATLSVHTSPLHQPGTGDAGGMNVYIVEVSRRLAAANVEVEIFTRATSSDLPRLVEMHPGVTVRHITAGPYEGLSKEELPAQLCAFTAGVLRAEAAQPPGWYDLVHSHYWLSGQVGWLATDRWGVPLVHSAHTLAKVKNRLLADGDTPEPRARVIGEEQVVTEADRLVANTPTEASELRELYGADPARLAVVAPGVDLERYTPPCAGREDDVRRIARRALGLPEDGYVVAFVGRIQPLKAPQVLLRAAAELAASDRDLARRLTIAVCGGPSGSGLSRPTALMELAGELGLSDRVRFLPPRPPAELADVYRAADLIGVPSHNESFGLVALEAQACGTPVVAAAVGGLVTAVADGVSGVLVNGHHPAAWARVIGDLLRSPARRALLARGAAEHARRFSWDATAQGLLGVYRDAMSEHRARFAAAALAGVS
jgi:D-inositol-3-phosphate glycosyltransferase